MIIPRLYMTLEGKFSGIRCANQRFTPVSWNLSLDVFTIDNPDPEVDWASARWQTLSFWASQLLDSIVIYDINDPWAKSFLFDVAPDNPGMSLPGSPQDDLILQTLFEKANSIGSNILKVSKGTLRSSDVDVPYHIIDNGEPSSLPGIEYVGENTFTSHKEPWWKRFSSEHLDISIEIDESSTDADIASARENITQIENEKEPDILEKFESRVLEAFKTNQFEFVFEPDGDLEINLNTDIDETTEEVDDNTNIIEPWKGNQK